MPDPLATQTEPLASSHAASQHGPRPLPLFLSMLRSETAGSPDRIAKALAGLRAYQTAERVPGLPLPPSVVRCRGATLHDYGGSGPAVMFVPSLINPPTILDLDADRSLLRWLATQSVRPLLLDWGADIAARRDLDIAGHVEHILLPLLAEIGECPALVGYCLGGTMALAAAALADVRGVATIAAPWHFDGFDDPARTALADLWSRAAPAIAPIGALPMEVLQSAFWSLDPARTVAKFEAFAAMAPDDPAARAFVRLENWANDGPPIPLPAARDLFETMIADDLPGRGSWTVSGTPVDLATLACPVLTIASTTDRIVPHATAPRVGYRIDLALGHVGMVIGRRARPALWEPLADWLSSLPAS